VLTCEIMASVSSEPQWYVGWGTLALINAGLAQPKNRSGLAWFIVSLLLGPLATLLVVLLGTVPRLGASLEA